MKFKIIIYSIFTIAGLISLAFYQGNRAKDGLMHVIICDVGQGDGIYIRTPDGQDIVIDGGPDNSMLHCLSSHMPFWDRTIELMVMTHPHADHYMGLISIAKSYEVKSFASSITRESESGYKTLIEILDTNGVKKRIICRGDKFSMTSGVVLDILWPRICDKNKAILSTDPNDNSVIARLSYKEFQLLLTGDAGEDIEDEVDNFAGDIDVLKVPHHGSRTGFDSEFLSIVKPELAVISVGAKNRYKHPAPNILEMLKQSNVKTLRTDRDGQINISTDGVKYEVDTVQD